MVLSVRMRITIPCGPIDWHWRSHIVLALVVLGATGLAGCFAGGDPAYPYAVLNDSEAPVIVEVRLEVHETYVVPAHAYGWLFEARSPSGPGWVISTVDQRCNPIASWPIDGDHNLLYVAPSGQVKLTTGVAYEAGLRSARSVTLAAKDPTCPDFVGSVVNDSVRSGVLDELGVVHQTWPCRHMPGVRSIASGRRPTRAGNSNMVDPACNILDGPASEPLDTAEFVRLLAVPGGPPN